MKSEKGIKEEEKYVNAIRDAFDRRRREGCR